MSSILAGMIKHSMFNESRKGNIRSALFMSDAVISSGRYNIAILAIIDALRKRGNKGQIGLFDISPTSHPGLSFVDDTVTIVDYRDKPNPLDYESVIVLTNMTGMLRMIQALGWRGLLSHPNVTWVVTSVHNWNPVDFKDNGHVFGHTAFINAEYKAFVYTMPDPIDGEVIPVYSVIERDGKLVDLSDEVPFTRLTNPNKPCFRRDVDPADVNTMSIEDLRKEVLALREDNKTLRSNIMRLRATR